MSTIVTLPLYKSNNQRNEHENKPYPYVKSHYQWNEHDSKPYLYKNAITSEMRTIVTLPLYKKP